VQIFDQHYIRLKATLIQSAVDVTIYSRLSYIKRKPHKN